LFSADGVFLRARTPHSIFLCYWCGLMILQSNRLKTAASKIRQHGNITVSLVPRPPFLEMPTFKNKSFNRQDRKGTAKFAKKGFLAEPHCSGRPDVLRVLGGHKLLSPRKTRSRQHRSDGPLPTFHLRLLGRFFQQTLFQLFLAFDAVPSPGHSLQALGIDFLAAADALAEAALTDAIQRALHHLEQLPIIITLVKEEFLVIGVGGLVSDILGRILIGGAAILFRPRNHSTQFLLARLQPFFECLDLLLVHNGCPATESHGPRTRIGLGAKQKSYARKLKCVNRGTP